MIRLFFAFIVGSVLGLSTTSLAVPVTDYGNAHQCGATTSSCTSFPCFIYDFSTEVICCCFDGSNNWYLCTIPIDHYVGQKETLCENKGCWQINGTPYVSEIPCMPTATASPIYDLPGASDKPCGGCQLP